MRFYANNCNFARFFLLVQTIQGQGLEISDFQARESILRSKGNESRLELDIVDDEQVKDENTPKESSCPEKPALPVKATVSLQIEKKGPVGTSERKHMPPKRYGIDLNTKERGGQENEEK